MSDAAFIEQRQSPRYRVDQPGSVLLKDGATLDCTILDLGAYGARLEFAEDTGPLPRRFELLLAGSDVGARVRVLWQNTPWVGVLFEPETPPRRPGVWGWLNKSLGLTA